MKQLSSIIFRFRWYLSVICIVAVALLAPGGEKLKTESDYRIFFDADDPGLLAHEAIENTYTKSDNITFVLVSNEKGRDLFTPENVQAILYLTEQAWQLPYSIRVDSISNFQHTEGLENDLIVEDLIQDSALSQEELQKARQIALQEPQLVNRMLSSDATATSVIATLQLPDVRSESDKAAIEAVNAARELKSRFKEKFPSLEIYLAGQTVVVATFNDLTQRDMTQLFPLMLGLCFILLIGLLRSVLAAVVTFIILIASIISTFGVAGLTGIALNQVNAITPMIILTLAICDCVHLYNGYFQGLQNGLSKKEAMQTSLKKNIQPVFLTSLTTAIGFLSLNFSDAPPFRTLGTLTAIGVGFAMVYSLALIPSLGVLSRGFRKTGTNGAGWSVRFWQAIERKPKSILLVGGVGSILLASFTFLNELNDSTIHYFKPTVPFREAADVLQERLTGFDMINYSLDSGEENGVNDPAFLKKVEAFSDWYLSQPEVVSVITYTDTVKRLNRSMNADDDKFYTLPDSRELTAQYNLLYELSLPFGLDLNNQIDIHKSSLKVSAIIKDQKARQLIDIDQRAQDWMQKNTPDLKTEGAGISLLFARLGQNNIKSMIEGVILALVLITLTLCISLRSVKLGLVSALPNIFPGLLAMGVWGLFSGEVNLAVAAILSITMGIVVDDTVHFMDKYQVFIRDQGKSPAEAIQQVFREIGPALVTTSLVLAAGFFVLSFSDFNVNADMGLMVAITIIFALVFDLVLLPAFLYLRKMTP